MNQKCTITLEAAKDNQNAIAVSFEFTPPLDPENRQVSEVEALAALIMSTITNGSTIDKFTAVADPKEIQ